MSPNSKESILNNKNRGQSNFVYLIKSDPMTNDNQNIDVEKVVKHWINTSDEDYKAMLDLFASNSFYWALFLGHISIEKLLKAYYVSKNKKHAPFSHNLYRLAQLNEIEVSEEQADWLDKITSFNINARYNDYKREFYNLCTFDFTKNWIEKITEIRIWIKQML